MVTHPPESYPVFREGFAFVTAKAAVVVHEKAHWATRSTVAAVPFIVWPIGRRRRLRLGDTLVGVSV